MRLNRLKPVLLLAVLALLFSEVVFGWPWNTDMYWHQSIRDMEEPPIPPAPHTVSIGQEPDMTREQMRDVENPIAPTPDSVEKGKELWGKFCLHCHGPKGKGDGKVAAKFVTPADLTMQMYVDYTDGFIYGSVRNGIRNMPPQGVALDVDERWHLVNYIRSLQKR